MVLLTGNVVGVIALLQELPFLAGNVTNKESFQCGSVSSHVCTFCDADKHSTKI